MYIIYIYRYIPVYKNIYISVLKLLAVQVIWLAALVQKMCLPSTVLPWHAINIYIVYINVYITIYMHAIYFLIYFNLCKHCWGSPAASLRMFCDLIWPSERWNIWSRTPRQTPIYLTYKYMPYFCGKLIKASFVSTCDKSLINFRLH